MASLNWGRWKKWIDLDIRDLQKDAGGCWSWRKGQETDQKLLWHAFLITTLLPSMAECPGERGWQVVHGSGICLHLAWARLSRGYNGWWTLLSHASLQWLDIYTEQCVRHCAPQCMGVEAWPCPQMDQSGKEKHNVSGKRWDGSMETAVVGEDFRGKLGLAVGKIWHKRGGYCLFVWTGDDGTWGGLGFSPEIPTGIWKFQGERSPEDYLPCSGRRMAFKINVSCFSWVLCLCGLKEFSRIQERGHFDRLTLKCHFLIS